ncbi:unnamed protein product, partial [Brassica oleracea var. botrytis]
CRDNGRDSIARTCVNWGSLHEPFHIRVTPYNFTLHYRTVTVSTKDVDVKTHSGIN